MMFIVMGAIFATVLVATAVYLHWYNMPKQIGKRMKEAKERAILQQEERRHG